MISALIKANKARPATAKPTIAVRDGYQIPRFAFTWLIAAVVSVILPHVLRMPLWLTGLCAACMVGRVLIWQGRMSLPSNRMKMSVVGAMAVLIVVQFGRDVFSTDATVGVLLVGITLKMLEMHQRRDVLMVIYLCYFTVVAEFIYSQSIPIAVYMGLSVAIITSALMSLHQTQESQQPWRTFKLSGVILLQSVPLMAAFFLLFPRISPLWSVPLQTNNGTTGLSENMSPGDIGELARSAEVAFRVKFTGESPDYSELYWRAITMDEFNGRQWRRAFPMAQSQFLGPNPNQTADWFTNIDYRGRAYDYNVILEPTYENWIYTLQMPQIHDDRMLMRRDYQIDSVRRVTQRYTYDARSYLDFATDTTDPGPGGRSRLRALPQQGNTRAKAFATELRATVSSDEDFINAVLANFRNENFFYTLSPPTLGDNPVDEFLFDTRKGFCEHFASSFTFLMRAVGIPARVVTGYMGGEYNPYDGTLTVRQYDAHAWSEVWIQSKGWVRVDPTAAVAPQRVQQGSNTALQQEAAFMDDEVFTLMRFRDSQMLNDLRLQMERIDYAWNRFVLNYDQDMQFRLFNSLFGVVTQMKIVLAVVGFMLAVTVFVALTVFRKSIRSPLPPATRYYLHFCDYMASIGFARRKGESPSQYLERIGRQQPQWYDELERITQEFTALAYSGETPDPQRLKRFQRHVQRVRLLS
jgi:transglutaminase-like putative cysteine protease